MMCTTRNFDLAEVKCKINSDFYLPLWDLQNYDVGKVISYHRSWPLNLR